MTDFTPTPWHADLNGDGDWAIWTEDDDCIAIIPDSSCADPLTTAIAARIVHCVNTHDELLEALEEAQTYVQCHVTQVMPKGGVLDGKTMLRALDKALKKARGES